MENRADLLNNPGVLFSASKASAEDLVQSFFFHQRECRPGAHDDDFRLYLSRRQIQPSVSEWVVERPFVENRLKTEIFNQAFGVEKGDEIEARRDPAIRKAVEALGG